MEQDVFKIFKDLEMKAVGLDPQTNKVYKHISITYGGTPPAEARLPALASTAP